MYLTHLIAGRRCTNLRSRGRVPINKFICLLVRRLPTLPDTLSPQLAHFVNPSCLLVNQHRIPHSSYRSIHSRRLAMNFFYCKQNLARSFLIYFAELQYNFLAFALHVRVHTDNVRLCVCDKFIFPFTTNKQIHEYKYVNFVLTVKFSGFLIAFYWLFVFFGSLLLLLQLLLLSTTSFYEHG